MHKDWANAPDPPFASHLDRAASAYYNGAVQIVSDYRPSLNGSDPSVLS